MSIETTSNLLHEVLTDSATAEHVRTMYHIGTELFHESAFAVYKKLGSYVVSNLLLPEIDFTDIMDEYAQEDHESIDTSPLILIDLDPTPRLSDNHTFGIEDIDDLNVSVLTRTIVFNIDSAIDVETEDKGRLISAAIQRDLREREDKDTGQNIRDDIIMLVHNHPQAPFERTSVARLLMPSSTDIFSLNIVRQKNPTAIECIVTSDTKDHGMMLIAASKFAQNQDSTLYEPQFVGPDIPGKIRNSLAHAGYTSVTLSLDDDGRPKDGQLSKLYQFAANIDHSAIE